MKKVICMSLWLLIAALCLSGADGRLPCTDEPKPEPKPPSPQPDPDDNPQVLATGGSGFEIRFVDDVDYSGPVIVLPSSSVAGAADLMEEAAGAVALYQDGFITENQLRSILEDLVADAQIDETVKEEALSILPGLVDEVIVDNDDVSEQMYDLSQHGLEAAVEAPIRSTAKTALR